VFYFSGTGNTYVLAKVLAKKINAEIASMPEVMETTKTHIESEIIVLVFPSYLALLSGLPMIVERFVRAIENIGDLTIFGVCNCGGYEIVNALPSLKMLRRIVRSCGGNLYAEYSLRLPMNNLDYDHIPIPINRNSEDIIRKSKFEIDRISNSIMKGKKTRFKMLKNVFLVLMEPMFKSMRPAIVKELREKAHEPSDTRLPYNELIPLTDKSIRVDDQCTGCGICAKVCPVGNIRIVDGRPEFQHRCEMCFACDEWCPANAVHHWSRKNGVKYHHPEVHLKDMMKNET